MNFEIIYYWAPLNYVFAMDLALRNGEYKERSGNQVFNGLQANVMN